MLLVLRRRIAVVAALTLCGLIPAAGASADPVPSESPSPATCEPTQNVISTTDGTSGRLAFFPDQPLQETVTLKNNSALDFPAPSIGIQLVTQPYFGPVPLDVQERFQPALYWNIDGGSWQKPIYDWDPQTGSRLSSWVAKPMRLPALAAHSQHSLGFWISFSDGTPPGIFHVYTGFMNDTCPWGLGSGGYIRFAYDPRLRPKAAPAPGMAAEAPSPSASPSPSSEAVVPTTVSTSAEPAREAAPDQPTKLAARQLVGGVSALAFLAFAVVAGLRALRSRRLLR